MTIVEKIKALMAKAASTDSEHEAEAFLAKAYELMEKHQLDAADLEHDDPVDGEAYYQKGNTKAAPDWDMMLIFSVAKYFGCKACRCEKYVGGGKSQWYMDLVGRESARVTAKEMHAYLVKTVRRIAREKQGSREFRIFREVDGDTYWTGEYMNADQIARRVGNALRIRLDNLSAKLHKPEPSTAGGKNALITLDRVVAVYNERHPNATNIGGPGYRTTGNARKLAEGIGLNLQTGGSAGTKLLGGK